MINKLPIDAIIFNEQDAVAISECILKPIGLNNVIISPNNLFNIKTLLLFIYNLKHLQLFYYPKKIISKLKIIFQLSIIQYYNPRIVISILDDDFLINNLALIDSKRKY